MNTITQGYALNPHGGIRAFDPDAPLLVGEVPFADTPTADEIEAALPGSAQAALLSALASDALAALAKSDITVTRCSAACVKVPAAWLAYRRALADIAGGRVPDATSLPDMPPYPAGT